MSITKCTLNEVIVLLSSKKYEKLKILDSYAVIYVDDIEILFELNNGIISDELSEFAVKVLRNLKECVRKAYNWLEHYNLSNDKMFSKALDNGFEISGIYFGKFGYGHQQKPLTDGFTISFSTENQYPCDFTVKFHKNMHPFAVEEWVF